MSSKIQSSCKVCRRLGVCVFKYRCGGIIRKPNPPGQHGSNRRQKVTPYALQLTETQKLRHYYGISGRQLRRYYLEAAQARQQTNVALVQKLETRLDNIVYRLGFAGSLPAARQMVVHRHMLVNGKNVNKPGFQVKPEDVIQLREKSQKVDRYKEWFQFYEQNLGYLQRDTNKFSGKLLRIPERSEVPIMVEDQMVVEFMAR